MLLAAAVPARLGDRILELGTGTGVAALCLARRVPGCRIVALELQPELAAIATENVRLNGLEAFVSVYEADLRTPPASLEASSFDHVFANPPYAARDTGTLPPYGSKALAVAEADTDLACWTATALDMAKPRGTVTFIHRTDRLAALLGNFGGRSGEIVLFPLWPSAGKPSKRLLLRARKGSAAPLRLAPGLVLHEAEGGYTSAAQAVLRGAASLEL